MKNNSANPLLDLVLVGSEIPIIPVPEMRTILHVMGLDSLATTIALLDLGRVANIFPFQPTAQYLIRPEMLVLVYNLHLRYAVDPERSIPAMLVNRIMAVDKAVRGVVHPAQDAEMGMTVEDAVDFVLDLFQTNFNNHAAAACLHFFAVPI